MLENDHNLSAELPVIPMGVACEVRHFDLKRLDGSTSSGQRAAAKVTTAVESSYCLGVVGRRS